MIDLQIPPKRRAHPKACPFVNCAFTSDISPDYGLFSGMPNCMAQGLPTSADRPPRATSSLAAKTVLRKTPENRTGTSQADSFSIQCQSELYCGDPVRRPKPSHHRSHIHWSPCPNSSADPQTKTSSGPITEISINSTPLRTLATGEETGPMDTKSTSGVALPLHLHRLSCIYLERKVGDTRHRMDERTQGTKEGRKQRGRCVLQKPSDILG